jgi:hypothetical protein
MILPPYYWTNYVESEPQRIIKHKFEALSTKSETNPNGKNPKFKTNGLNLKYPLWDLPLDGKHLMG